MEIITLVLALFGVFVGAVAINAALHRKERKTNLKPHDEHNAYRKEKLDELEKAKKQATKYDHNQLLDAVNNELKHYRRSNKDNPRRN